MKNINFLLIISFVVSSCTQENTFLLQYDEQISQVRFAAKKLTESLGEAGLTLASENAAHVIHLATIDTTLGSEAFHIRKDGNTITVTGGDAAGLLYGGLDVAEQIRYTGNIEEIEEKSEKPRLSFRAIKFNLPWDSYRRSEALQLHMETCRDTVFWESFLDMMAENRFNTLTLWNLHPFNYLIRPANFPEASGFSDEELAHWQQFWHTLFRMAKERSIETYLVNWNIFVSPEFAKAHNVATYSFGETHFTDGDTSEIVKRYTRECVTQVINEYPELTGLGVALGEGMGGMSPAEREQWILDTFVAGIQEADREIKFIHRMPLSANTGSGGSTDQSVEKLTRAAMDTLRGIQKPIYTELKFNWSHGHATPQLVKVHGGPLTDVYWNPEPESYQLCWMIRNEDFFTLRWGQAGFIREHITLNAHDYVAGYYVGSECYIPAKDYFTVKKPVDWKYAFERQWLFYKLWGRLLYNPETPNAVFSQAFAHKYGEAAQPLFDAYQEASKVQLQIASFYNGTWDFTLYSEGFLALGPDGTTLISVEQLIDRDPLDPDYVSIRDFVAMQEQDASVQEGKISPPALADSLENEAERALAWVENINTSDNNSLLYEVADVKAWAHLGRYFAEKLRGATALYQFRQTQEVQSQETAITHLETAAGHWKALVGVTEAVYEPVPLTHLNEAEEQYFHWSNYQDEVQQDIEIARNIP